MENCIETYVEKYDNATGTFVPQISVTLGLQTVRTTTEQTQSVNTYEIFEGANCLYAVTKSRTNQ